jgi:hypothetical protein
MEEVIMNARSGSRSREVRFSAALLTMITAGCFTEAINGPVGPDLEIHVVAAGGIAARTFGFVIEGESGIVRIETCTGACTGSAGDIVVALSAHQLAALVDALESADIFALDGTDFGTACCDQVDLNIRYRNRGRSATVSGTTSLFPERLRDAAARLNSIGSGLVPAVVAFSPTSAGWPSDPLTVEQVRIDGPILSLVASYGGGCEQHAIDVVAWNGWLESFPVQVGAIVAHDAHGDPCDAFVSGPRQFDLTPLRTAYEASYGPGAATIVINLTDSNRTHRIEYRF